MTQPNDPKAGRPNMPDYGISTDAGGVLPWSWARERLERTRNYYVGTTRADGRPHAAPVWGVWMDGMFIFSTASGSRKARNFAANPHCVVTTEDAAEAVILEGVIETVSDAALVTRFKKAYVDKYSWNMDTQNGPFYALRPSVAFGFIEAADQFHTTATRWTFG
ncbi:MAG: pyridoxamine 5'-phosphate oxidase family protein [Dehalococcoidia bacterium]